jgi:proton translocating ATP synthase F1 alpha subunit
MRKSYNTLVIFDDLSQHAVAYRQITLLLRRPPGREAYPGDIFYVQARLLERGAQLSKQCGAGSVTIIPLIETRGGDIAAYIPTNVISITDGQVFLTSSIINKGLRPGINLGLSVSRVGSKAQFNCIKYVSKKIKRDYMLFKTYESLSKISSDIDPMLITYVRRGNTILKYLSQKLFQTVRIAHQTIAFQCLSAGYLDDMDHRYLQLFFDLYFKGFFVEAYLEDTEKLFKYLILRELAFIESVFITASIEPLLSEVTKLSKLFISFFTTQILTKIAGDYNNIYYNLISSLAKQRLFFKN